MLVILGVVCIWNLNRDDHAPHLELKFIIFENNSLGTTATNTHAKWWFVFIFHVFCLEEKVHKNGNSKKSEERCNVHSGELFVYKCRRRLDEWELQYAISIDFSTMFSLAFVFTTNNMTTDFNWKLLVALWFTWNEMIFSSVAIKTHSRSWNAIGSVHWAVMPWVCSDSCNWQLTTICCTHL